MAPPTVIVVGELLADLAAPHGSGAGVSGAGGSAGASGSPESGGSGAGGSGSGPAPPSEGLALIARPGGSPANIAVGLARLGVTARFSGRISTGGLGPWLGEHLRANGVDLQLCVAAPERPTLAVVTLDQSGVPAYSFYGADTADWHWQPGELPDDSEQAGASAVHSGSLACALPPGAAVLADWLDSVHSQGQVLVSYDPNIRPGLIGDLDETRRRVEGRIARAHLVKASEEDLAALYPGESALEAAQSWIARGPELVVVTLGHGGALGVRPERSVRARRAVAVEVVDTVGAGDSFAAALLAWLADAGALHPGGPARLSDDQVDAALDTANAVASITCSRAGADPPRRHEVAGAPWPHPRFAGG